MTTAQQGSQQANGDLVAEPGQQRILTSCVFVASHEYSSSEDELSADESGNLLPSSKATSSPRGLCGLQNLGNTCYMNSALQALSNCPQLTRFMLDCSPCIRKVGLARTYMRLIKEMWHSARPNYVAASGITHGIKSVCPIFKGYAQQDTQEFLRCFLDQLHEELKEPIIEPYSPPTEIGDGNDPEQQTAAQPPPVPMEDDSNSDADYETCDSGLSSDPSEKSAFEGEEPVADRVSVQICGDLPDEIEMAEPKAPSRPSSSADCLGQDDTLSVSMRSNSPTLTLASSSPSTGALTGDPCNDQAGQEQQQQPPAPSPDKPPRKVNYKSIISDVFDGKLLSSVQCLTCDNISTTRETFQDLSLPIPSRDQLHALRAAAQSLKESNSFGSSASSVCSGNSDVTSTSESSKVSAPATGLLQTPATMYRWVWDWIEWMMGLLWGPTVSLQDCLSAFFSADELKGDNMYSCEKCSKLRNGMKYSKVVQLPDVLCIHLKRFRHDLMYSSKISSTVTFPLEGLDMGPYLAGQEFSGKVTTYDLVAAVCHHGTPASGHYTAYCLNNENGSWYEFDDQYVTAVDPHQVASCEAYVLFYRKVSETSLRRRQQALELMKISHNEPSTATGRYFISKQWINKFNTFAEPGPISNHDFLCEHGLVAAERTTYVHEICTIISRSVWEYLHAHFGGGPVCTKLQICRICT